MNFKKIYIILFPSFLYILSGFYSYVGNTQDKLLWDKNRKLKWTDFQGIPNMDDSCILVASTQTSIEITDSSHKNGIPVFKVCCFFVKNKSWTKVDDDYTLDHEQLHFDIGEIYTRKIRKEFDKLNAQGIIDVAKYQKVFDTYLNEVEDYNEKYDNEVYFNEERQALWRKKIKSELEELKEYEIGNVSD
ncbi:hypothetical protein E0W68_03085 [Flavobacterium salilacus subsp. salilacus]|uniref:hypothetical protein n=1 Tax=Flavobacterium TaxID=237 RepID=UPI001074DB34|nr:MULTISPECIES: hypothetical protein [Flavobacterium]KAF2519348.1 hypothetical protein E0W68_03085 [Flavobacterium salilacus subsp. salilacus]MBE1614762.1 hypothetical protein [Flavobacterium sp. SaA2.13]